MNDASVRAATTERWPEMVSLVGGLLIRALGVGIAAGSLLLLAASMLA
jgi:hypothetical protein